MDEKNITNKDQGWVWKQIYTSKLEAPIWQLSNKTY